MPPLVWNFISPTGGAPLSLPCVRGGAARSAAQGLYLTETIFFSFLQTFSFYNPSGAPAPAPFTQGSLGVVRTLRECTLLLARATIGRPPENNPPFRLSRHFSAKSQKTPFFSRVDRSTNFRKRLDTGRETCYNVLTCRGAAFSPSRAGSAARGFNAGRLG